VDIEKSNRSNYKKHGKIILKWIIGILGEKAWAKFICPFQSFGKQSFVIFRVKKDNIHFNSTFST